MTEKLYELTLDRGEIDTIIYALYWVDDIWLDHEQAESNNDLIETLKGMIDD